jgi:hypothetical protein
MAYYLVQAKPSGRLDELASRLEQGEIRSMRPFGKALEHSLRHARVRPDGFAVWEEEDYCSPPLAQERKAVLDRYFTDLSVERVDEGEGWRRIEALPGLWERP